MLQGDRLLAGGVAQSVSSWRRRPEGISQLAHTAHVWYNGTGIDHARYTMRCRMSQEPAVLRDDIRSWICQSGSTSGSGLVRWVTVLWELAGLAFVKSRPELAS